MDRMNPLDAEFLYLEDGTAHAHRLVRDLRGPAPTCEELVERIRSSCPLVPGTDNASLRADGLRPFWVDDPTSTSSTTCATAPCHPRRQG